MYPMCMTQGVPKAYSLKIIHIFIKYSIGANVCNINFRYYFIDIKVILSHLYFKESTKYTSVVWVWFLYYCDKIKIWNWALWSSPYIIQNVWWSFQMPMTFMHSCRLYAYRLKAKQISSTSEWWWIISILGISWTFSLFC